MSTPSIPDNRIRLPAPKIDFDTEVGTTGQDHDNYPSPSTQARFDHMRMFLIGLLANQSSYEEPSEYREGTIWFDLGSTPPQLRIWLGSTSEGGWQPLAKAIVVGEPPAGTDTAPTLWDLNLKIQSLEARLAVLE